MKRTLSALLLTCALLAPGAAAAAPEHPVVDTDLSRVHARALEMNAVHGKDQLCGCEYRTSPRLPDFGKVNLDYCAYQPRRQAADNNQIAISPIVTLREAARGRSCLNQADKRCVGADGRQLVGAECCAIIDPEVKGMQHDLFNYLIVMSEIARDLDGKRYAPVAGGPTYGSCDVRVDFSGSTVEPPAGKKGDIARVYLYMRDAWNLKLSPVQTQQFERWHAEDPPDEEELKRSLRIFGIQKYENPYLPIPERIRRHRQ